MRLIPVVEKILLGQSGEPTELKPVICEVFKSNQELTVPKHTQRLGEAVKLRLNPLVQ